MKRALALCLALLLGLTSCASMLERDYLVTADHVENPPTQGDAAYRVESYAALRPALMAYIEEGIGTGLLHFPTTYGGNLSVDLEKARRQLTEEDPIAAYALEDMTFQVSRIISYYEVTLNFTYRVTAEELQSLPKVKSGGELTAMLQDTLRDFGGGFTALVTGVPEGDPAELLAQRMTAFYDENPQLYLGSPTVAVTTYPRTGSRRVVEVSFVYAASAAALRATRARLLRRGEALVELAKAPPEEGEDPRPLDRALFETLREVCTLDPEAPATPAAALLEGTASGEGMALAYKLLCDLAGVPAAVERTQEGCYIGLTNAEDQKLLVDVTEEGFPLWDQPAEQGEVAEP